MTCESYGSTLSHIVLYSVFHGISCCAIRSCLISHVSGLHLISYTFFIVVDQK